MSQAPPPAPSSSGRNAGAPIVEKGPRVAFQIVPAAQVRVRVGESMGAWVGCIKGPCYGGALPPAASALTWVRASCR